MWARAFHALAMMKPRMMTIMCLISELKLTLVYINLVWLSQT